MLRRLLLTTTLALVPTAPATAQTLTPDQRCYVEGERMNFAGAGWLGGSGYLVDSARIYATGFAEADGTFTAHDDAPPITARGIHPRTVTVKGRQNGITVTHATFEVVGENLFPTIDYGSPVGAVTWHVSGLLGDRPIYFHVVRGSKTYTTRLGTGNSCGAIAKRLTKVPGVPSSQVKTGVYTLYADNRAGLRKGGRQQVKTLHIFRNGKLDL